MARSRKMRSLWGLALTMVVVCGALAWAQTGSRSGAVLLGTPATSAPAAGNAVVAAEPTGLPVVPLPGDVLAPAIPEQVNQLGATASGKADGSNEHAGKGEILPPPLPRKTKATTAATANAENTVATSQVPPAPAGAKGGQGPSTPPGGKGLKGPKLESPSPEEGLRPPQLRPSTQAARGANYNQRAQFGSKTRTYKEEMTKVGLFWWRDNTKEFTDREYKPDMPAKERHISEGVSFGDGLFWRSKDEYFTLTFHNLTQLDMRETPDQGDPLHGGFAIPRQRWYFQGKVGDYADFVTSINRGYGTLDVLDSYVDFVVNREWLKFRVGRFKMPSQYEYVEIAEGDLLGPERSVFVANYAANRQLGAAAQGYLFDRRIRYWTGVGSGPRRSFEDFNSSLDYFFFVDYRPFMTWEGSFLRYLHLVGTYNFGEERNPLSPFALRTLNQESSSETAAFVSPTILEFNNNVFENGPRAFWGFEPVWYYKSFGFLGSLQGGYQGYSNGNLNPLPNRQNSKNEFLGVQSPHVTEVPINGWSVGCWYFLTGEEITARRFLVEPRRPFGYYNGTINPGAFELFGRFANMTLGNQIFSQGLVNPALWTNRANCTDVGVNWYLTHYVKFTFDWQHTFLGGPVILNPSTGEKTSNYDMFLFRTQLYF